MINLIYNSLTNHHSLPLSPPTAVDTRYYSPVHLVLDIIYSPAQLISTFKSKNYN